MMKLYIKTYGCQMNEYDSDKMADVLRACGGMEQTDKQEEADVILFNTCSIREKAEEKVFSDLGRARELKLNKPESADRRGRLRRQPGGRGHREACTVCRCGVRSADAASLAAADCGKARERQAAGGYQLPRNREVRSCADSTDDSWLGLCLHHGGLQQILHLLRGALYARRRDVAPARPTCCAKWKA